MKILKSDKIQNYLFNIYSLITCLIIIFIFGLWPFSFYSINEVKYLDNENGVNFYGHGIIYSAESLSITDKNRSSDNSISIELILKSRVQLVDRHFPWQDPHWHFTHILSLYDEKEVEIFSIDQWKTGLVIRSRIAKSNTANHKYYKEVGVKNIFKYDVKQFITITSDVSGTSIFLNGKLLKSFNKFAIIDKNIKISGQLVLGNSANGKKPWEGNIFGLAIYKRVLPETTVLKSYTNWTEGQNLSLVQEKKDVCCLYLFNKKDGSLVRNSFKNQYSLLMPNRFHIVKKTVLSQPWNSFQLSKSSLFDIFINITGFIPLGFLFSGYLLKVKRFSVRDTYLTATLTGGVTTLIIELLQVNLLTRTSSFRDLICNFFGALLGIIIVNFLNCKKAKRSI